MRTLHIKRPKLGRRPSVDALTPIVLRGERAARSEDRTKWPFYEDAPPARHVMARTVSDTTTLTDAVTRPVTARTYKDMAMGPDGNLWAKTVTEPVGERL
jgi:hypothetical protein